MQDQQVKFITGKIILPTPVTTTDFYLAALVNLMHQTVVQLEQLNENFSRLRVTTPQGVKKP